MAISNKIGLGTVQFGLPYGISNSSGQTSSSEVTEILNYAYNNGIEFLDSASAYGDAEQVLGQNDLSGFVIISKFMPPFLNGRISDQLSRSLLKFGLSGIYAYLAHRPMELLNSPEQWEELKRLKDIGKVKKIGFSLNEPEELRLLLNAGLFPDLVQVPYNYFDRRFENGMEELKEKSCEIHTRSSFLQGLFFINPNELNNYFNEVKPILLELQKYRGSLPGRLLNFVLEQPLIDKVIIGVENQQQLADNLKSIRNHRGLPDLNRTFSNNILIPSRWPQK